MQNQKAIYTPDTKASRGTLKLAGGSIMSGSEGARRRNYISENMNKVIFEKPQLAKQTMVKDSA